MTQSVFKMLGQTSRASISHQNLEKKAVHINKHPEIMGF
jgi:hypothetical protein